MRRWHGSCNGHLLFKGVIVSLTVAIYIFSIRIHAVIMNGGVIAHYLLIIIYQGIFFVSCCDAVSISIFIFF